MIAKIFRYTLTLFLAAAMILPGVIFAAADDAAWVKEETLEGVIKVKYNEPVRRVKETLSTPARREAKEYDVDIWTRDTKIYIERGYHHKYKELNINFMIKGKDGRLNTTTNSILTRRVVSREVKNPFADIYSKEYVDILTSPEDFVFYDWNGNKYTEASPDLYMVIDIAYIPDGSEEIKYIPKIVKFDIAENDERKGVKKEEEIDKLTLRKNVLRGNMETYNAAGVVRGSIKFESSRWDKTPGAFTDGEYDVEIWDENTSLEYIYSNHDNAVAEAGFFVKKSGMLYRMLGIEEGGFERNVITKSIYDGVITLGKIGTPKTLKGYIYDLTQPEDYNKSRDLDKNAYTLDNSEIYGYVRFVFKHENSGETGSNSKKEDIKLFKFIKSGTEPQQKEGAQSTAPAVSKPEITKDYVAQFLGHSYEDGVVVLQLKEQGRFGIIDRSGKITYDVGSVGAFHEGIARVIKDNLCGFIDNTGRAIVPPKYEHAGDFSDGMAIVMKGGLYGYIDKTGKEVIPLKYSDARDFSEGLAAVMDKDYNWIFIDKTGRQAIAAKYSNAGVFSEGLAPVANKDNLFGYIDKTGREVIKPKYSEVGNFHEGYAYVSRDRLWGYIDKTGRETIPPKFRRALEPSNGIGLVQNHDLLWGYVDVTGREIVPPKYLAAYSFSDETGCFLSTDNYMMGYVDKAGREVVPPKYKEARAFSDGLAAVTADNLRWGFIDTTGREVLPMQYRFARNFKGDYAVVKIEKGLYSYYGLINRKGEEVIPAEYDDIIHVSGNIAFTLKNNRVEIFKIK